MLYTGQARELLLWLLCVMTHVTRVQSFQDNICRSCDDARTPEQCNISVVCKPGDLCYTESFVIRGQTHYKLGCSPASACVDPLPVTIGKKRYFLTAGAPCRSCCKGTSINCNKYLCNDSIQEPAGMRRLDLISPRPIVEPCVDLIPSSCQLYGHHVPHFCRDPRIAFYACKKYCRTCGDGTGHVTDPSTSRATHPPVATWSHWNMWVCKINSGSCYRLRERFCSTGESTDCPDIPYAIEPCTSTNCPEFFRTTDVPTFIPTSSSTATTTPTTAANITSAKSCSDDPAYRCDDPDILSLLCLDRKFAEMFCQKTCGFCGHSSTAATVNSPTLTDVPCSDYLNCSSEASKEYFCHIPQLAVQYCRKSCNRCDEAPGIVTINSCGDPVKSIDTCRLLNEELCICNDPAIKPLCPNYCAGKCGSVAHCTMS